MNPVSPPNVSHINQSHTNAKLEETILAQSIELKNLRSLIEGVARSVNTLSQSRITPSDGARAGISASEDRRHTPRDGARGSSIVNAGASTSAAPTLNSTPSQSLLGHQPNGQLSDSISGSISQTLNQRLVDSQLIAGVTSFDGDKSQFRDWRTKIENVQPLFSEELLRTVV